METIKYIGHLAKTQNQIELLRDKLRQKQLLDDENNFDLSKASDADFLAMFFNMKIVNRDKPPSPHTMRAYRQDLKVLLEFLDRHNQPLKKVDFVVVKIFNQEMRELYANRTAVRRLDFFRRILEFGYITGFYKNPLVPWIDKPSVAKGHYRGDTETDSLNRTDYRELSEEEARLLAAQMPETVKSRRYQEQYKARNALIGKLLFLTGMRASEVINLNWGSFRRNHKNRLIVDVVGKGGKERTIPIFSEVEEALNKYRLSMGESSILDKWDVSPLLYNMENYLRYNKKKRLSYTTLFRLVKKAVAKCEMDNAISPHWFRHSFCTTMLTKDIPLSVVKQTMGHSNIATTNIYLERLKDDNIVESFDKAGY